MRFLDKSNNSLNTILWKIFFLISVFGYLCVVGRFVDWSSINPIFFILTSVAFFGVVWNKKIFNRLFWKIVFISSVVWRISLFIIFIVFQNSSWGQLRYSFLIMCFTVFIVFALPRYVATYLYAFRSDKIWENDKSKKIILK